MEFSRTLIVSDYGSMSDILWFTFEGDHESEVFDRIDGAMTYLREMVGTWINPDDLDADESSADGMLLLSDDMELDSIETGEARAMDLLVA